MKPPCNNPKHLVKLRGHLPTQRKPKLKKVAERQLRGLKKTEPLKKIWQIELKIRLIIKK
ncbi:hypothetical protein CEW89_18390 [Celeribacter ethanolicus]|uniref:Uncharacterized protein n=1 Tax=Celeribacter ethanolicus TaxID=1758178 RepID=A0A291GH38_9RHOB|nr:hypothetical protein CEW89_18390 [Celeribacter ethanolicus]